MNNGGKMSIVLRSLIVVGVIGVVALLTSQPGGLGYFSAHTLQYRSQSERTFFATGIPFYRSSYEYEDHPLIAMLVKDGFLSPQPDTGQWILVFHWNQSWKDGYGRLYDVLNRDTAEIIESTQRNPQCAMILWSEGFRYLRSDDPIKIRIGDAILREGWRSLDRTKDPDDMRKVIQRIISDYQL